MIQIMSEDDYRREASDAFSLVFQTEDAFREPFTSDIKQRWIYFNYGWEPPVPLERTIATALTISEEPGFFYSVINRTPTARLDERFPTHMYIPASDFAEFRARTYPVAHALYPSSGKWGVMSSYEDHAVVGGDEVFKRALEEYVPDLRAHVYRFIDYWIQCRIDLGSDISWMPGLLEHILGKVEARVIIQQTGLAHYFEA